MPMQSGAGGRHDGVAAMSNVTSLRGDPIPSNGEANETLVTLLTGMLADAEAGKLIAMAWCEHHSDGTISAQWSHQPGSEDRLSTGLMVLQHDFVKAWIE
jgi:hypothetical protein